MNKYIMFMSKASLAVVMTIIPAALVMFFIALVAMGLSIVWG